MKRLILTGFLVIGVLTGWFSLQLLSFAGNAKADESPAPRAATDERFCADATGDGELDLSDAVRVLNYLFLGGEPPYCLAQACPMSCKFATRDEFDLLLQRVEALCSPRSFVSVLLNRPQEIPTDTWYVRIKFDGELDDSLDEFDPKTHKFTARESGIYLLNLYAQYSPAKKGGFRGDIYVNETAVATCVNYSSVSHPGSAVIHNCSRVIALEPKDTVDARLVHWAGSNVNLVRAKMQIVRLDSAAAAAATVALR